ncbi:MAG: DUF4133 domain-containing protein [Chitinophagaceae bacterium]|nr:MAG: DUF4133 domain-containing protein [Chitinophagaceae bacterium]
MASIYQINKGVSKPIVFKGLVGAYIAYLAVGLVLLLIAFAVLYISGVSLFVVLPLVLVLGTLLFVVTFRLSQRFREHGLMKFLARKALPKTIRFRSRRLFTSLKYPDHVRS